MSRLTLDAATDPDPTSAPFGSWTSPITASAVVQDAMRFSEVSFDGDDLYWLERRPAEEGRSVVVRRTADGTVEDCMPANMNARTSVHEYGGGSYVVEHGVVYLTNFEDHRIYRISRREAPRPLTAVSESGRERRFADLRVDPHRSRIICVMEEHGGDEPANSVVAVDLDGRASVVSLVSGADFYSNPVLSDDGRWLAWLTWQHPNMPWDGTILWRAEVQRDGSLAAARRVAGGASESVFQPRWSLCGDLVFVSDRSQWWNLYRQSDGRVEPLTELEAEIGLPAWVFGMSTWAFGNPDPVFTYSRDGIWHLAEIRDGAIIEIESGYSDFSYLAAHGSSLACVAASPRRAPSVVVAAAVGGDFEVVRSSSPVAVGAGELSAARTIDFPTLDGDVGHAFFYAPVNAAFTGVEGELPMLLVLSHGGPTASASSALNLAIQYWTSRGFAVVDVNYRGSTGFGRRYRQALDSRWGQVDVDDCIAAALFLAREGLVDEDRLAIRGGSAGGFTTLAALAFRDVFKAGASYYGVGDLEALALETHKFESRYMDRLVAPYPRQREVYLERSPLRAADRISCPVIFFQGLEDKVVPPNQAESMVAALRAHGIAVAYVPFAGEQHGFRRAHNIERALEAELYFYSRVFGFEPADDIVAVDIYNSKALDAGGLDS